MCEAGGRGLFGNAAGMAATRHFSILLVHFRVCVLGHMRAPAAGHAAWSRWLRHSRTRTRLSGVFSFCELWKVLVYLATGDERNELAYQDEL